MGRKTSDFDLFTFNVSCCLLINFTPKFTQIRAIANDEKVWWILGEFEQAPKPRHLGPSRGYQDEFGLMVVHLIQYLGE